MFRKILITVVFASVSGYCVAAQNAPQIVTSEVMYEQGAPMIDANNNNQNTVVEIPAWPIAGSDADINVSCDSDPSGCVGGTKTDNIKIVSKIGSDLVIENNFNTAPVDNSGNWSGGANMLHGNQVPAGFDDECDNQSDMPLMHREMLEDDGGQVLAASRSSRRDCGNKKVSAELLAKENTDSEKVSKSDEIAVDQSADAEVAKDVQDQVRSWVVASGQTLREVLQDWCNKEGWDFVWATSREYPIEASAVFKGRFVDVSSALVRNFGRATPIPYAKFYKGNRVLVVSTTEE